MPNSHKFASELPDPHDLPTAAAAAMRRVFLKSGARMRRANFKVDLLA